MACKSLSLSLSVYMYYIYIYIYYSGVAFLGPWGTSQESPDHCFIISLVYITILLSSQSLVYY